MRRLLALAVLATTGCASMQAAPPAEPIRVQVAAPQADAVQRTASAFMAEGLTVAQSDAGVVTSLPVPASATALSIVSGKSMTPLVTYRANIVPSGGGSLVVLTMTTRMQEGNGAASAVEHPIPSNCTTDEQCGRLWAKLEGIATRLRQ